MQYCRIISLDNNNSVKFTSSRGYNSTTNDSTIMKIAHAKLHMYTNFMYKFLSSTCKTVREKLQTKLCPQTHRQTAMAIPVYSLRAISPFPPVFSKALYCRHIKTRACLEKGKFHQCDGLPIIMYLNFSGIRARYYSGLTD